ncbi:hypothetical protein T265_04776 [Opisthorchis viverrini]|uniref:Transcription factor BTF3 n=1 Tax=Opisthorchis viverrini TaxID=6198 RepID=A0A075AG50_OPIVI|nr:hypothetical protein T265_04776 [Opisthorchis viverrini]KER28394.1 hypothetical protein T265_04776 [Opisthorchis viverrini]
MDVEKARLEKLEKLRNMSDQVRIGGKGTARRKKKVIHKNAAVDDKKLQSELKKLNLNTIPTIEEVNMYKADGTLIHFKNPKVQASPQANVFAVSGQAETKPLTDLFPNMLNQLESAKLRLSKMSVLANVKHSEVPTPSAAQPNNLEKTSPTPMTSVGRHFLQRLHQAQEGSREPHSGRRTTLTIPKHFVVSFTPFRKVTRYSL